MRVGLFGGTFDPVHLGHLILAEQCREQCDLDEVWFLPSGSPPHKPAAAISEGRHRTEMLRLALAGHASFRVSEMELTREGPTYTVDTLTAISEQHPDWELFFLIGGDSLSDLPTWRQPQRILQLATIVAANRGDRPLPDATELLPELAAAAGDRIRLVAMPGVDLSATDLRRRVRSGRSIRYLVPRAVEVYIQEHGLYSG